MKKYLLMLPVLLATSIFSLAATTPIESDLQAQKNFNKQFSGAENVQWTKVEDGHSKVSFTWAGHRTEAYFSADGQFAGAIRGLFFEQLPLNVIRSVDKRYQDIIVLEVREITNLEGTTYSLLIEKQKKRLRVKMDAFGNVEQERKIK